MNDADDEKMIKSEGAYRAFADTVSENILSEKIREKRGRDLNAPKKRELTVFIFTREGD